MELVVQRGRPALARSAGSTPSSRRSSARSPTATLAKRDRRTRHLAAARYFEGLGDDELAGALAAHYVAAYEAVARGPGGRGGRRSRPASRSSARPTGRWPSASPEQAITFLTQAVDRHRPTRSNARRSSSDSGGPPRSAARPDVAARALTEAIEIRRETGRRPGAVSGDAVARPRRYMSGRMVEKAVPVLEPAVAYGAKRRRRGRPRGDHLRCSARAPDRRSSGSTKRSRSPTARSRSPSASTCTRSSPRRSSPRAAILCSHGRPIEGLALISGRARARERYTLPAVESRALTNLTHRHGRPATPRAAWDLEIEALAFARRIGRRDMELTLIGNAGEDAVRLGDWDWLADELAAFDDIDLPAALRLADGVRGDRAAHPPRRPGRRRGHRRDASRDRRRARQRRRIVALTTSRVGSPWRAATSAAPGTRWLDAGRSERHQRPVRPAARRAGRDAGRRRRRARDDALDRLTVNGTRGRVLDVERTTIEAGIAALEGRTAEAVAGYRAALAAWAEMDLPWDQAWAAWSAVLALGTVGARGTGVGRRDAGDLRAARRQTVAGASSIRPWATDGGADGAATNDAAAAAGARPGVAERS